MFSESIVMRTETRFSDDKLHRYLLRKEWNSEKPRAAIIMTNPSMADLVTMDFTTMYILNNLAKLDFGAVDIVNMVSSPTTKLKIGVSMHADEENLEYITEAAKGAEKFIIAWGKLGENNQRVRDVQNVILERLRPFKDKLYLIGDGEGNEGFHPLAPQIRFVWVLKKFDIPEAVKPNKTDKAQKKKAQKSQKASVAPPDVSEAVSDNDFPFEDPIVYDPTRESVPLESYAQ
ncbi:hypothetical protein FACS1894216_20050 [Synergistales bacterium]|nr:hypothetical protein FACS1894216_20050 [Synergistales bacterium]